MSSEDKPYAVLPHYDILYTPSTFNDIPKGRLAHSDCIFIFFFIFFLFFVRILFLSLRKKQTTSDLASWFSCQINVLMQNGGLLCTSFCFCGLHLLLCFLIEPQLTPAQTVLISSWRFVCFFEKEFKREGALRRPQRVTLKRVKMK